jgi:hypothetical protein
VSGRGNAAAMETTERFPPRLGNLAQNARFPHSHRRSFCVYSKERTEGWTAATNSGTLSAQSDEGTPGGKVLKTPGPYLLKTHSARRRDPATAAA